jgi:RHS repeat-associated protein
MGDWDVGRFRSVGTRVVGRWRVRRRLIGIGGLAIFASSLIGAAPPGGLPATRPKPWQPVGLQVTPSVPGHAASAAPAGHGRLAQGLAARPYHAPKVSWPSGSASTGLSATPARAGSLPVTVASADASAGAASAATVSFASRDAAAKAGISGVVFTVERGDGLGTATTMDVSLSYASFAAAYGGGYADRLHLVALPACALTTPQVADCRVQTPLPTANDTEAGTLTARVAVGEAAAASAASTASPTTADAELLAVPAGATAVLAATSSSSGGVGSYAATSLSPAGQWSAGGDNGSFSYTYPIPLPPALGTSAPGVTLAYDSRTVDGRTSATNAQASWIGDGWDYAPGFIERSYLPCAQDGIANSGDVCWGGNQLSLMLGSHSSILVRDDTSGTWKLQNDDGTKVAALTGVSNGAWQGEAWKVTTPDGTQYYFGQNHLPTTTSTGTATQSAWTEPVYCPKSGDGPPGHSCFNSTDGTNSFVANMSWRWNLDYVVDPHGNLQVYSWVPETNYYNRGFGQGNGHGTNTIYTRGGYLQSIAYGYRLSDAIAGTGPLDEVNFGVSERCLTTSTFTNCSYSNLSSSTASNWPDVPFDQICATQSGTCATYSPAFFSTKRLTSITTRVLVGTTYDTVDTYTLDQMFPAPEAGVVSKTSGVSATNQGDGTVAVMWLNSIQHTGNDTLGGGTAASLPPVTFVADEMPNRVDGAITGAAALYRPRMDSITTESGAQIVVSYQSPQCSRVNNVMPASEDTNTMSCFPQFWVPTAGSTEVEDWFNTYPVTMVTVNDLVAPAAWSEAQVTSYSYAGIAWHRDDSPLTKSSQRTWNQFRGYRKVTTTTGAASVQSVPTQTVTTYLQGMDGDHMKDGTTRSVSVPDSVGDSVTDSAWLEGDVLETQDLLGVGGAAQKKTVNGPWTYTSTATESQASSMPALVARMEAADEARQYRLWHDGSWKKTETDTSYDGSGRSVKVDDKGDGTAAVPEVCTTTSYAQDTSRNMLTYPDRITAIQGACGTTATTANTVSDERTFYDASGTLGALSGPGDVTKTDAVDSYASPGSPSYVTEGTTAQDVYGRVTSSTDADGHTTTTTYSAPGASPDTVTVKNPMGWTTVSTLDPGRELPISATDVNNELTTKTYDGLGRLTAAWSPLHAQSGGAGADAKFAYAVSNSAPTTVTTSTLRDDGLYNNEVKVYDGQLRVIQDQNVTRSGVVGRLLTDTHYNSLGQAVKTTSPYYDSSTNPTTKIFVAANDSVIPSESESIYDGLGRVVNSLFVADGVNQWSTVTAYRGTDQTDVTPPAGGTATSTFDNALGDTVASWSYRNAAAPTDNAADAVVTAYTYTASGKTSSIQDAAQNAWQFGYDLHDRQTSMSDPGAGSTTTTYSPGGEVLSTKDARGVQLSFTYDNLARRTGEYDTTGGVAAGPSNQLAAFTYDTLAKGEPTSATRYTDGASDASQTYTQTTLGYTALYQPTGTSVTIPSAEGKLAGTYQTVMQFSTATSMLAGESFAAEGGLPREQVNYSYNLAGSLSGFGGTYTYLNTASYDPQGHVLQTNFGVNGKQVARTETYDLPTGHRLTQSDALQTLSSPLDTTSYTYSQSGLTDSVSTSQSGSATADTQCFTYDRQQRLTAAWTDTGGVNSPTTGQVMGIGGCKDASPVAGKVTGGPAPYWESFAYDALGNRVSATNHDTSVTSTANDVAQTMSFNGYNAATGVNTAANQPAAVQSLTTKSAAATTTSAYTYDAAGDTMSRAGQSFTYDAEGHVQTVTNTATNTTSTYLYANGSLLIQRDPASSQVILYLPWGEEIHLDTTGTGTVSGLRYHTASPDGIVLARSSTGTLTYELTDSRDTAVTTVDASSLAVSRRYLDPYGNVRGPAATSWPDQHGYLNKPSDPSTGLSLLGTRQYDPATGRFLSVDPILDGTDPQQMNGYVYGGDNPVSNADPSGAMFIDGGGGGGGCVCPPPRRNPSPPPPIFTYFYYPVYTPPTYFWFARTFTPPVFRPKPPAPRIYPPKPPSLCDTIFSLFCSGMFNTNRSNDSGGTGSIVTKLPSPSGCAMTWISFCLGGGATVGINLSKKGKGGTGVGRPNGGPRRGGGKEPPLGGRIPPGAPGYVRPPMPKDLPTDPSEWDSVSGILRKLIYIAILAAAAIVTICETNEAACEHHSPPPPPPPPSTCHAAACIGPASP